MGTVLIYIYKLIIIGFYRGSYVFIKTIFYILSTCPLYDLLRHSKITVSFIQIVFTQQFIRHILNLCMESVNLYFICNYLAHNAS